MKRLNLGGNELTSVPQKALSILDTLKKLEIQENKIRYIAEGDFEGMASLLTNYSEKHLSQLSAKITLTAVVGYFKKCFLL